MAGFIEYDSNNSGGHWWLKDEDWKALEDAGWFVQWTIVTSKDLSHVGGQKEYISAESGKLYGRTREEAFRRLVPGDARWAEEMGERNEKIVAVASTYEEALALREQYGGYIGGTLACSAIKEGDNPHDLVAEFERVAGQCASDEGCNCCGPPHSFKWYDDDGTQRYATARVVETELAWD